MSDRTKAIVGLIFDSACYSTSIIAIRLMGEGLPDFTQVYLRIFLGMLMGIVVFNKKLRYKKIFTLPKKDLLILILMGFVGYALAVYFVTVGSMKAKMINVSIIFSTIPLWTYIYAILFLKKKLQLIPVLLIVASVLGISIIATDSIIPQFGGFGVGEIFVLGSAVCFAIYYTGTKVLSNYLNDNEHTIIVMFFAFLGAFVFSIFAGEKLVIADLLHYQVLIGLFIMAIFNILTTKIEMFAFKKLESVFGSQLLLFENLFSLILGFLVYDEGLSVPEIVGSIIIVASVFLANRVLNK